MEDFNKAGLRYKFFYSVFGLVLGLACIISGSLLGLYGVSGHTTMVAQFLGLNTQLNDAPPGVVIAVVGVFMVVATRFKVRVKDIQEFGPAFPPIGSAKTDEATRSVVGPPSGGGGGGGGGSRRVTQVDYNSPPGTRDI
ncbi:hypothetical protein ASE05_10485 [Mesorhizobium sp. Root172]|nr:hypothetical protein ASE05_10485 [Mesorhizobium sp. Root172]